MSQENYKRNLNFHSKDVWYKGTMYLKLVRDLPPELILMLSDLSKGSLNLDKYKDTYGDTEFFKQEIWKYLNIDFGRTFCKETHTVDIEYNSSVINQFKDYTFKGYYLFIYFKLPKYYEYAEKLIDIVKYYISKYSPYKIGTVYNTGRNYKQNLYVNTFVPNLN